MPSLPKDEFMDIAVKYVAHLCCTLMNLRQTSDEEWVDVKNHLALLTKTVPSHALESLKSKCADMMVAEPVPDDDEDAEELCNCQFTLAYGESSVELVKVACVQVGCTLLFLLLYCVKVKFRNFCGHFKFNPVDFDLLYEIRCPDRCLILNVTGLPRIN